MPKKVIINDMRTNDEKTRPIRYGWLTTNGGLEVTSLTGSCAFHSKIPFNNHSMSWYLGTNWYLVPG